MTAIDTDQDKETKRDSLLNEFKISHKQLSKILIPLAGLVGLFTAIVTILLLMIKHLGNKLPASVKTVLLKLKNKLMFNSILRYILQQFYKLSISTSLNLRLIIAAQVSAVSLLCSIPASFFLIAFTVFAYYFLRNNRDNLAK